MPFSGDLAGQVAGGQLYYIQPDHLGSPRLVVDPQRDVAIWRWDLRGGAFGSDAPAENPDQDGVALRFDLRFPGQRHDPVSGLNYNYFRDYEPATGRYLQSDPIGLEGGWSTYGYVGGSPVNSIDPLGLDREIIFWNPLPNRSSMFGHVSSVGGNGQNFSFGTGGWDTRYPTAADYAQRQTQGVGRGGLGVVVVMNKSQDVVFDECMQGEKDRPTMGAYNLVSNNCTTSAQGCLIKAGVGIPFAMSPAQFQANLFEADVIKSIIRYRP